MKQYTDKDQTAKLIELGFRSPVGVGYNYSIGELIEFLKHRIYRIENDMQWLVDGVRVYRVDDELINALFEACVALKEEGVL